MLEPCEEEGSNADGTKVQYPRRADSPRVSERLLILELAGLATFVLLAGASEKTLKRIGDEDYEKGSR